MGTIFTDRAGYSLSSATNSATGSAIDARVRRGFYAVAFVTGGSAVITIQAGHTNSTDVFWLPISTITALDGVGISAPASVNPYSYLRAQSSGYAGATASVYIAPGQP